MNSVYKLVHTNTWTRLITVREFVSAPKIGQLGELLFTTLNTR